MLHQILQIVIQEKINHYTIILHKYTRLQVRFILK